MLDDTFGAAVFDKPLARPIATPEFQLGARIVDIITQSGIPKERWVHLRVVMWLGGISEEVSMAMWGKVMPKAGVHVEIYPELNGAAIGPLLSAIVASSAPALAGFLFPALGSTALAFVTAGITVVGQLIVSALIPPPTLETNVDAERFSVSGVQNTLERYAPYPKPVGRRRMAPKATATGYTEVVGDDIYFVGRYTFGHGPIALEDLMIGETPASEFEDIEWEFLNINEAETKKNIPQLGLGGQTVVAASAPKGSVQIIGGNVLRYTSNHNVANVNSLRLSPNGTIEDVITYTLSGSSQTYTVTVSQPAPFRVRTGRVDGEDVYGVQFDPVTDVEIDPSTVTVVGWRQGTESLTLYNEDIYQADFSAEVLFGTPIVRRTQNTTKRASIDITFQGLGWRDDKGRRVNISVPMRLRYRLVGAGSWIDAGVVTYTDNTLELVRFTREIEFPAVGEYELEISRTAAESATDDVRNTPVLTAIRSIQDGDLPSHENIAEVAVRVRATGQLNGRLDTLNATVLQLGREWDGSAWSALKPIRHPAWVLYDLVTGPSMKEPFAPSDIDLDSLKAWADLLPWAQCDYIFTGIERAEEAFRLICATGFAYPAMNDLKFGVIVDGANGPRVQSFGLGNAYNFEFSNIFPTEIHAFRVRVASEILNWEEDEVIVYADGYAAQAGGGFLKATKFEEITLSGVVLEKNEGTQGNAWRHGRYHLAVAALRPLRLTFSSNLDHLRCQRGDKVGVTYDAAALGVGDGRIKALGTSGANIVSVNLDDDPTFGTGTYRLRFRKYDGSDVSVQADCVGQGQWNLSTGIPASEHLVGDLVFIESTTNATADFLVIDAEAEFDEGARLECILAAPDVLNSYTGTIPNYVPNITGAVLPPEPNAFGPAQPNVTGIISDAATLIRERDGSVRPVIRVEFKPTFSAKAQPEFVELQYRVLGSAESYSTAAQVPLTSGAITTGALDVNETYELILVAIGADGLRSQRYLTPTVANDLGPPAKITNWIGVAGATTINLSGPAPSELDIAYIQIYAATDASTTVTAIDRVAPTSGFIYEPQNNYTRYKVAAVDHGGLEGPLSDFITVVPSGVGVGGLAGGLGGNRVRNATFVSGLSNIRKFGVGAVNSETVLAIRPAGQSWAGASYPTLMLFQNGTSTTGYSEAVAEGDDATLNAIPVEAGQYYEFNAKLSLHRCVGKIRISWRDATGAFISISEATISGPQSSSTNPDEWPVYVTRGLAPANAAFANWRIFKEGTTSGSDSYVFIHKPVFGESHPNASQPIPWSDGGQTAIEGSNVKAESLDVQTAVVGKTMESAALIGGIPALKLDFQTGDIFAQRVFVAKTNLFDNSTAETAHIIETTTKTVTSSLYTTILTATVTTTGGALLVSIYDQNNGRLKATRLVANSNVFSSSETGMARLPAGTHTILAQVLNDPETVDEGPDLNYTSTYRRIEFVEFKQAV